MARRALLALRSGGADAGRVAHGRAIVTRVVPDAHARHDPLSGLVRVGIDEVAYKRGHRYGDRGRRP